MASGPEHYRRAEGCMDAADDMVKASQGRTMAVYAAEQLRSDVMGTLAAAQVHATLALAAATADCIIGNRASDWSEVT